MSCNNCKLNKSDCGHHFTDWNNEVHLDIPSESCCDRFGNCMFYKKDKYNKDEIVDVMFSYSFSESNGKEGCVIVTFIHKDKTKFVAECSYEWEGYISIRSIIDKYYL